MIKLINKLSKILFYMIMNKIIYSSITKLCKISYYNIIFFCIQNFYNLYVNKNNFFEKFLYFFKFKKSKLKYLKKN